MSAETAQAPRKMIRKIVAATTTMNETGMGTRLEIT
jgi:hypothetical protein